MIHVISLGAGVQSSTMALMAAHGEITPMPDCAIFADTGWEPKAVYEWLDWLEKQLPYPVHRVAKPGDFNIREHTIKGAASADGRTTLPFFVRGTDGKAGPSLRKCTGEFKIAPIETFIKRELLRLQPRQKAPSDVVVTQWRGISLDEIVRMKPSDHRWMTIRYPLAMELRMSRTDCLRWMERNGYPRPPRSACIGCPYHDNNEWRDMRDNRPDEWADAIEFDSEIRNAPGYNGAVFLHRQLVPLSEVDLSTAEDNGQQSMFDEDCAGMCGV